MLLNFQHSRFPGAVESFRNNPDLPHLLIWGITKGHSRFPKSFCLLSQGNKLTAESSYLVIHFPRMLAVGSGILEASVCKDSSPDVRAGLTGDISLLINQRDAHERQAEMDSFRHIDSGSVNPLGVAVV